MGNWIQTSRSEKCVIGEFRAEQFDPGEAARVLSGIRRFSNHTHTPYNVADHSVRVCELVEKKTLDVTIRMGALIHDVPEAYSGFGDVTKPAKELAPIISKVESQIARVIEARLGLPLGVCDHKLIKFADAVLLATELRDLMSEPHQPLRNMPDPLIASVVPRTESASAAAFIDKYEELMLAMRRFLVHSVTTDHELREKEAS